LKVNEVSGCVCAFGEFHDLLISITRGIYGFYYRFRQRIYLFRKLVRIPPDYACEEGNNKINIFIQISKIDLKAASEFQKGS